MITGPHSPGVVVVLLVVVEALVVGAAGVVGALGLVVEEDEPVTLPLVAQSAEVPVVVPVPVPVGDPVGVVVVTVSVAVTVGVVAPLGVALVLELDVLGLTLAPLVDVAGRFG
jgi:hypothetical protein